jgi:hypothetical protein
MFFSVPRRVRTGVYFACLVLAAFLQPPPASSNKASAGFRWLDRTKDAQQWVAIQAAFANELKPDTTSGEDSPRRFATKFIPRIGLYGSSTLVLIGQREDPSPDQPTLFQAYNYNLVAKQKNKISGRAPEELWQLRVLKEAKFEDSPVPDIVFSFKDCSECESVTLLGSFQYGAKVAAWSLRAWGTEQADKRPPYLEIAADIDTGTIKKVDVLIVTKCAYRIADFNEDGLDDIADWCRVSYVRMDPPEKEISTEDRTILFTRKEGSIGLREVLDKEESASIRKQICSTQSKKAPCNRLRN